MINRFQMTLDDLKIKSLLRFNNKKSSLCDEVEYQAAKH